MKRILLIMSVMLPILLSAQSNTPKKNKMSVEIMRPINLHQNDFERNLAHHNKEFHSGANAVDIYEVVTGDHMGEYNFVFRNPMSWAGIESTFNDAGKPGHAADWDMNIASHLSAPASLYLYEISEDSYMPPSPQGMQTELMGIYLIELVPGMEEDFFSGAKKISEMYKKSNSDNYYLLQTGVMGKGSQVVIVFPLAKGWESFEPNPNDDWSKMFKAAFPKEDFKAWSKKFNSTQKSFESMVVRHRKDLSSDM
ncbi:MAG: hypothetical protein ABIN48_01290 [Ginsengibacter sp.]